MKFGIRGVSRSGFTLPAAVLLATAGFLYYSASIGARDQTPISGATEMVGLFAPAANFPGAGLGAIPDGGASCPNVISFRNVTFNVTGLGGRPPVGMSLSMTFGSPNHTFVGDLSAVLIAPNGSSHSVFGRTGATTATSTGDSSDLGATYVFSDNAPAPPSGGWWQAATAAGSGDIMPTGTYRTTASGGTGATNPMPATNMDAKFATLPTSNGIWTLRLSDGCTADTGSITAAQLTMTPGAPFRRPRADFDGDGKTDLSVFRPSNGIWYSNGSTAGFSAVAWGASADIPVPGDYDGDLKTDFAIFRPSNSSWWILRSATGAVSTVVFGTTGDIPVVADWDADGRSDLALYRPSTNRWFAALSQTGATRITVFGSTGDLPVPGDYDGDGVPDIAIFRPSTGQWWIDQSSGPVTAVSFGLSTDQPVPADYDGDAKQDVAIYRPSNGQWWMFSSLNGIISTVTFGLPTDIPVPGDYDGDGKDDQAIYRDGTWWQIRSSGGVTAQAFGLTGDRPIPAEYIP